MRDKTRQRMADLRKARKSMPVGETAFTPPVSLVLALEESLAMIREELKTKEKKVPALPPYPKK